MIRALADLEAAGLIGVERRAGHGSGRLPNVYRLDLTGELQKAKRQFGTPQSATTTPPKCQPDTRQSANPVSYTHLDVYKRQAFPRAST